MSSSDQQYPYPYDPERQQPASPHWPDGTAGQSAVPQEPAAFDQGATQTWQAPTWDTQYQPTIRPDGEPHRAQAQAQGQGYGQPPQPDPYGQHRQQPGPYGTPEPHPPYQQQYQEPQYQEPQHQQQYQEPQQPYRPPAADTACLPPQGPRARSRCRPRSRPRPSCPPHPCPPPGP